MIIDTILGAIGTGLGILNILRDRTNVIIQLKWDMTPYGMPELDQNELYGFISIANTGRRPIFLSHVHLLNILEPAKPIIPTDLRYMAGQAFSDTNKPQIIPILQKTFNKYEKDWYYIRACVIDLSGKEYYSKLIIIKPSWGEDKANIWLANFNFFKFRLKKIKTSIFNYWQSVDISFNFTSLFNRFFRKK